MCVAFNDARALCALTLDIRAYCGRAEFVLVRWRIGGPETMGFTRVGAVFTLILHTVYNVHD